MTFKKHRRHHWGDLITSIKSENASALTQSDEEWIRYDASETFQYTFHTTDINSMELL